jgi:hypothetical protein
MGLLSEKELQILENVLATNPKAKRKIVNAVKEVVPDLPMPADVQAAEEFEQTLSDRLKPLQETIDALQKSLDAKEREGSWEKQVDAVKKARGWNDKQVKKFIDDLQEEYKDQKEVTLSQLAEVYDYRNRPLTPTQTNANIFGRPRGETELEWRKDVKDPNSEFMKAVRSKNQSKKKEYKSKLWNKAREEWDDMQRQRVGM